MKSPVREAQAQRRLFAGMHRPHTPLWRVFDRDGTLADRYEVCLRLPVAVELVLTCLLRGPVCAACW